MWRGDQQLHSQRQRSLSRTLGRQALIAHSRTFLCSRHGINLRALSSDCLGISVSCLKNNVPRESRFFTSRHNSTFRAFRWKLVTDLLPIGRRHQRWGCRSNLTGLCRICERAVEDVPHLFNCPASDQPALVDALHSTLTSKVPSLPRQLAVAFLADGILSSSYGAFTEPIKALLDPLASDDLSFPQLACKVLRGCHEFIYQFLWKPRCETTVANERRIGITSADKRTYMGRPSLPSNNPYKFGLSRLLDRSNWSSINLELTTI